MAIRKPGILLGTIWMVACSAGTLYYVDKIATYKQPVVVETTIPVETTVQYIYVPIKPKPHKTTTTTTEPATSTTATTTTTTIALNIVPNIVPTAPPTVPPTVPPTAPPTTVRVRTTERDDD